MNILLEPANQIVVYKPLIVLGDSGYEHTLLLNHSNGKNLIVSRIDMGGKQDR